MHFFLRLVFYILDSTSTKAMYPKVIRFFFESLARIVLANLRVCICVAFLLTISTGL